MSQVEQTQLLIAGGGPVGLLTALCAARQGLEVMVVERSFRGAPRGHTTLLHPSSIRLLSELGLSPLLLRAGQLIDELTLRIDSEKQRLELPYPALAITQSVFEEALLKVLRKEGVDLRATCEVTSLTQSEASVQVRVVRREQRQATGSPGDELWDSTDSRTIDAQFVIGADGRASRVRQALGIQNALEPMERYAMFELPCNYLPKAELVVSGQLGQLVTPLAGERARYSFQLAPSDNGSADLEHLATLLATRSPQYEMPRELHWSGVVGFEPAVADRFGRGRVWLAGDAAHCAGPLGVQSMNRGLTEAWQLSEQIASVVAGKQPLATLGLLGTARRDDWLRTLARDTDFELLPHAPRWLWGQVHRVVSALPASGTDLEGLLRQLGIARRERS